LRLICAEEGETQERKSRKCSGEKSPGRDETILSRETLWRADKPMEGSVSFQKRDTPVDSRFGITPPIPQERNKRDADETNRSVPAVVEDLER